ncbi:MAG: hypothetical protein RBR97_18035, partial [Bacteroidales bacterium]|nr:hypothetical protein [Bacteroidales bacterium]
GSNVTYESGYTVRGSTTSLSSTTAGLTCGTSYYLAVKATTDCNNTSSGYKTSNVFTTSACDASDPCASAVTMECGITYNATLNPSSGSWTNYTNGSHNYTGSEQVWSFTAPTTGAYIFNVYRGLKPADFFLMSSCSNTGTNLIPSPFYWSGVVWETNYTINLTEGETYYLIADLRDGSTSTTVKVRVICPAVFPVDACTSALPFCTIPLRLKYR